MRKFRQVLAIIGLILIAFFYIRFIVMSFQGTSSGSDLMLALAATIVIPVVLYIMQKLADRISMDNSENFENKNDR